MAFTGDNAESVASLSFDKNGLFGFMVTNTAAPVGSLHRTINGGHDWLEVDVDGNSGLNHVDLCGLNSGYVVGDTNAATGYVRGFGPGF